MRYKENVKFVNAQEMHKQYPVTFEVPSKEDLDRLEIGDIVKVSAYNERFWVSIIDIDKSQITAIVNNYLITSKLRYGDFIRFGLENVYSIFPRSSELEKNVVPKIVKKGRKRKPNL